MAFPGINYVKGRSKHVGVAEFRRGAPADFPTKGASSRLKIAADFVVQVYEADLIRRNLAYRAEPDYPNVLLLAGQPAARGELLITPEMVDGRQPPPSVSHRRSSIILHSLSAPEPG